MHSLKYWVKFIQNWRMTKVALITGSAVRIGREIAGHLADHGWNLAIHFNTSGVEVSEFETQLKVKYPNQQFYSFKTDLGNPGQTEKLISLVMERFGSLDLMVNNASVFEPSSLKNTTNDLLTRHTIINFVSPFILMRDFANCVSNGLIINILDTRITNNSSDYLAYSLSKKSLWELTKMAALELAPHFRVNAIAPGAILPPVGKDNSYFEKVSFKSPMKTPSGLISLLRSIDYILDNQDLTGQLIFCDGGSHLL